MIPKKKKEKGIAKQVFCVNLIAVRGPVSFEHVGKPTVMAKSKTPQSVLDALHEARSALYSQQYELTSNIQRIQRSIDASIEDGKEVETFDKDLLQEAKIKLANTIMARETLFNL